MAGERRTWTRGKGCFSCYADKQPTPTCVATACVSVSPRRARVTRAARMGDRRVAHRQPRPTHAASGGGGSVKPHRPPTGLRDGKRELGGGECRKARPEPFPKPEVCTWGDEGPAPEGCLRLPQPRRRGGLRLMAKRPSDRRSPGRNPGPQGAFEVSMINVSCNSH